MCSNADWKNVSGHDLRNEKARRFLSNMKPKAGIAFEEYFPKGERGGTQFAASAQGTICC